MESIDEGAPITIDGDRVLVGSEVVATGVRQTTATVDAAIDVARANMGAELERFADEHPRVHPRGDRAADGRRSTCPTVRCEIAGRHVLIVVRGIDYKDDLSLLQQSGYLRGERPVLIGVDGGADALLEIGAVPDLIIGDFDSVSEARPALRGAAHRARLHRRPGARAPSGSTTWACPTRCSRRRAPARTSPCCSPTRRAPS